jgi:hypothetical protein
MDGGCWRPGASAVSVWATPQPGWESAEQGKPEASLANSPARGIWEPERWADCRWLAAGIATGPSGRGPRPEWEDPGLAVTKLN